MARCPFAIWLPLPENNTEPYIAANKVILHSAVSAADSLRSYFGRSDIVVESHFYVRWDGTIEQYIDTARQADANYMANGSAISIETEDGGHPDENPWTDQQLTSLAHLITWICDTHNIPKRACTSWTDRGIGYHSQFSQWSNVRGKTCPGLARRPQVNEIIAAVAAGSVPVLQPPAPPVTHPEDEVLNWPVVREGVTGQSARNVQGLLVAAGRNVTVDGAFGPKSASALREWQGAAGLVPDGICGPLSYKRFLGLG